MSEVKMTPTAVTNALRTSEFEKLVTLLTENGYEVLQTKGAQFASPVVDMNGGERFIRVTLEVPKGDREGNAYDGYAEAQAFAADQLEKAEKASLRAEKAAKAKAEKEAKAKS